MGQRLRLALGQHLAGHMRVTGQPRVGRLGLSDAWVEIRGKKIASQQVSADGPPPGTAPMTVIAVAGDQVVRPPIVVTVTGRPFVRSSDVITVSAASIGAMPRASIAHIAKTSI